ncbi:MAG: RluA family pseudouridine synthase [Acidimicrobiales bacterium]
MSALVVTVPDSLGGVRVDRVVALLADLPRTAVDTLVDEGRITVDGRVVRRRSVLVRAGQELCVERPEKSPDVGPGPDESVEFTVVEADDQVIVVDKPAGLVVHPGAGHSGGTLVNGLLSRFPELASVAEETGSDPRRPGIVHRLDRGTSGLLVVARTANAYRSLVDQLKFRRVSRSYATMVWGSVEGGSGVVEAPIGRSTAVPTRMAVSRTGKPALTRYRVERRFDPPPTTELWVELETGRTHQIRVHLAAVGHPVVGDPVYGRGGPTPPSPLDRPFLHAAQLTFEDPGSGRGRTFDSPLPADLAAVLRALEG